MLAFGRKAGLPYHDTDGHGVCPPGSDSWSDAAVVGSEVHVGGKETGKGVDVRVNVKVDGGKDGDIKQEKEKDAAPAGQEKKEEKEEEEDGDGGKEVRFAE